MRNLIVVFLIFTFFGAKLFSQSNVGISENPIVPHPSSLLELRSDNKGLLIPRMTTAQRLTIVNPADGLLVFDTDLSCFVYFKANTAEWISLCDLSGNQAQINCTQTNYVIKSDGTNATCTTAPIFDNAGLVGIGTTSPAQKVHIYENGTNSGLFIEEYNNGQAIIIEENGNGAGILLTSRDNGSAILSTAEGTVTTNTISGHVFTDSRTNLGTSVTKTVVDISSSGALASGSTNIGLKVDVSGGTNNYTAIFTGGNVGVGTNTPTQKLHVDGITRISTLASGANGAIVKSDMNGDLSITNFTGNSGDVLLGNGNFGPVNSLAWLTNGNAGTNPNVNFIGTTDNTSLVFRTNNTEYMRLTNYGYLGIGTTTPNYKIHIHQDGTNFGQPGIQLTNSVTGTGVNDGARLATEGLNFWVDNRSNGSLCFATNTFERARFLPDGKFGINIAAPVNQVDINGNMAIGVFSGNYTAPTNGMIVSGNVRIGVPNASTLIPVVTDAQHIILDVTGGYTRIGNFNSSAVNINPGESFATGVGALAVGMNWHSGTSNVDFWNTTAHGQPTANMPQHRGFNWRRYNQLGFPELLMTLDGNGNLTIAGSNYNTSDKRIKSQIMPMEDGIINKIILLQPKTYYRNNPAFIDNKIEFIQDKQFAIKDFGLIAQDVYEIFPELVYKPTDENIELWAVDYSKLTVFLTKALQEQYYEIQKLKQEQQLLLKRLEELESLIKN